MTPFAIAGIQMHVSALYDNIAVMGRRLDLLMARFPWVQMVVFSELASFGPLPGHAQPMPGPAEAVFCQIHRRRAVRLRHSRGRRRGRNHPGGNQPGLGTARAGSRYPWSGTAPEKLPRSAGGFPGLSTRQRFSRRLFAQFGSAGQAGAGFPGRSETGCRACGWAGRLLSLD